MNKTSGTRRTRDELSSTLSSESPVQKSRKMADSAEAEELSLETVYKVMKDIQQNTKALVNDNGVIRKKEMKVGLSFQNLWRI